MSTAGARTKIAEIENETTLRGNTKQRVGAAMTAVLDAALLVPQSPEISSFTAAPGESYPVSGVDIVVTAPATPEGGDNMFEVFDHAGTWGDNPVTVDFGSESCQGVGELELSTAYESAKFRYESTAGIWRRVY
ncbi:hypothetical protein [Rosistilla oblonga]|uniref:hypothetical protein n=1 Tax=Rosistilla oblonga TaxID=2527990 RepID=UPI003A970599